MPARTAPLTRAAIADAAIALVERAGPRGLTMRALGAELGVEAMSLYHHVADRDALLAAVGDRLLEPLTALEPVPGDWRATGAAFARALRAIALAHPAAFVLVGLQPLDTPASLRGVERLLGALVGEGLPPAAALAAYRALASYARGYALGEAAGFTVDAAGAAGRERLAALEPEAFPVLAGRAEELAALGADAAFATGLDALLAGLPKVRS